ncbi:MAG: hypothetical protein CME59_02720 [Halioglobus sp.]|nr:hypothetical protein [Halioglobus sp.]|tara:strand:+ start:267 stop:680 length:414 start_codon:yes stop_codon:yes gene_type:complete
MATEFTVLSFLGRLLFAIVLVFCTYNPTEYSFVGWAFAEGTEFGPVVAIAGVALLIGWVIFLSATFQSLGWVGIALGAALFAAIIWLLVDIGWLSLESPGAFTWVALLLIALILGAGMSWSHIWRRLTGQFDVDEVD